MQAKTPMRYHIKIIIFILLVIVPFFFFRCFRCIGGLTMLSVSKGVEKQTIHCKQECNLIWPLGRAIEQYLVKQKMYNTDQQPVF